MEIKLSGIYGTRLPWLATTLFSLLCLRWFLANRYMLSPVRVCLSVCLSVTLVHPSQAVEIFGNFSTPFDTLAIRRADVHGKCYVDRPRGTPPPGELNTKRVAKYSDFGPIERYISETVQDRR